MARIDFGGTSTVAADPESLRAWCWDKNQWAKNIDMDRWYFVATKDGRNSVESREGLTASTIWKILAGWKPDYAGWPQEKLTSEYRIHRALARQGMPQQAFDQARLAG